MRLYGHIISIKIKLNKFINFDLDHKLPNVFFLRVT